ncbi:MAG: TIGR03016 family PEP-CTERM system-associated outer membrane protein [Burkholderiales bacterium]
MANGRYIRGRGYCDTESLASHLTRQISQASAPLVFLASVFCADSSLAQDVGSASPPGASAQSGGGWRITPKISIRETYTDNVSLSPSSQAKSDFITEIIPGITISDRTARSNLKVDYSLDNFIYASDNNRNKATHQLEGSANFEVVENLLSIDSNARIRQQATSLLGPIGADSATSNSNNQTLRFFSIGPHLRKSISRDAVIDARYTLSQFSSSDSSAVSNSRGGRFVLNVDSGPAFREFGWGVNFVDDRLTYKAAQDTTFDSLSGSLRYLVTPRLSALATMGYEKNDYLTFGDKPEGAIWNVGFDWRPSQRTSLSATVGKRFFGNTYSLSFHNVTRKTVWDLYYRQSLNTSRTSFSSAEGTLRATLEEVVKQRDPSLSGPNLDRAVEELAASRGFDPDQKIGTNFQSNTVFLEKRWQGSVSLAFPKSNMLFTVFNSVRDADTTGNFNVFLSSGDFAQSRVIKQTGAGAQWNYRLSPRNQAKVSLDLTRNTFVDIHRRDDLARLELGLSRKLSRTASGTLNYRHVRRDSNFTSGEYDENAIIGAFSVTF